MPIYKPRLTRSERAKYLPVAEDLLARGVELDIPDEWRYSARALRIMIAGPPASSIYQLASGLVVYAARVKLLAERGSFILQDFQIRPAWDCDVFPCGPEGGTTYRFAPGLEYEWNEVLNHRIENDLRLRRGDMRDGWLLATGYKPVPKEYGYGRPAPLEIAFLDQFSQEHAASAEFVVERSAKTIKPPARPRTGLDEREDTSEHVKQKNSEMLKRFNCRNNENAARENRK